MAEWEPCWDWGFVELVKALLRFREATAVAPCTRMDMIRQIITDPCTRLLIED